ncbi:MAG: ferrous iron transport protein A [Thermoanaerobaculia bacterium]|jgi:Fe2+ transport system protein FeoA|nr:MAG: ferrous iron transport protein A [Thermoanaerobaculia bacterium]MBZ0102079.1 ferrous iron transport protein A [Thermoanaerobaculia bacterium]
MPDGLPVPPLPPAGKDRRLSRLSELAGGAVARLHQRELSDGEACLLSAMGLTAGCRLVVRIPGDPTIVEVRSTRIGIARSIAEKLLVLSELEPGR